MSPSQHDPNKKPLGGHRLFPQEIDGINQVVKLAGLKSRTQMLQIISRHPVQVAAFLRARLESETPPPQAGRDK